MQYANLGKREHVSPCLIQLHWLPIRYRITYKLQGLHSHAQRPHRGKSPRYLTDIVQPIYFLQSDTLRPALSLSETDSSSVETTIQRYTAPYRPKHASDNTLRSLALRCCAVRVGTRHSH